MSHFSTWKFVFCLSPNNTKANIAEPSLPKTSISCKETMIQSVLRFYDISWLRISLVSHCSPIVFLYECFHSAEISIRPPFLFSSPPSWYSPFLRNMQPAPLSWHQSRGNNRFCDDTPESGRLKTIWSHGKLLPIETVS